MLVTLLPLFLSLAETAVGAVADRYIGSDTAKQFLRFGFQAAQNLTNAEIKLIQLKNVLIQKQEEAKLSGRVWEPSKTELDEINARIDARTAEWDKI